MRAKAKALGYNLDHRGIQRVNRGKHSKTAIVGSLVSPSVIFLGCALILLITISCLFLPVSEILKEPSIQVKDEKEIFFLLDIPYVAPSARSI